MNRAVRAFTMIELLVAMAVLAILVVMLLGLVDSASKLWRVNESRVDAYREARAAIGIIGKDLANAFAGTNVSYIRINDDAFPLLSGAQMDQNAASAIFFLSAQPTSAQQSGSNRSDLCQVGYFLAYGSTSMSPNSATEPSMNLYRFFLSSDPTFSRITNTSGSVFAGGYTITDPNVELLARNIKSFRLSAFNTNGTAFTATTNSPLPPIMEVEIVALNQEMAKKLQTKDAWTNSGSDLDGLINQNKQTFRTRVGILSKP